MHIVQDLEGSIMKKSFKMENLGCANCAARMEDGIKKLNGVTDARISFMTSRLTVETDGTDVATLLPDMQKIVTSYESDCKILVR